MDVKRICSLLLALTLLLQGCSWRTEPVPQEAEPDSEALPLATPAPTPTPTPEPTVCPHPNWENGECLDCGLLCMHTEREKGLCVLCGDACRHPEHDAAAVCSLCGEQGRHNYVYGACTVCRAKPVFEDRDLPEALRVPCEEKGTVETVKYTTHNYVKEEQYGIVEEFEKEMSVYLPYGYDPAEKYDLLILLHGLGGSEDYWLCEEQEYGQWSGIMVSTVNMLDQMIASGQCEKLIIACPTFYADEKNMETYDPQWDGRLFWPELRHDILPTLVERYSTYAADSSEEAISAARDHFGYAGLSMGSIITFQSVLPHCIDLFGWYGCLSGFGYDVSLLMHEVKTFETEKGQEYPIRYMFQTAGTMDAAWEEHWDGYNRMIRNWDKLTEGENTSFTVVQYARHDFKTWIIGLYNCLQVFFQLPAEG